MRLNRLDLTRYGRFTGKSLSFTPPSPGGPDLHILFGRNEAGKSTLFSAWLDLLFGIPLRTRYDFLHPGPTLRIGAEISHANGVSEIHRLKRNGASLFDRHDAPLPESLLQTALGGLTREGYSSMFSLDDQTLEDGGNTILASRGDLGEMLFSASAGLAGLSPRLAALRQQLDGFHRSGRRSGWLSDRRKDLAELDRRRKAMEVSATALKKLAQEEQAAARDWTEAREAEEALRAALDLLQEQAATLPMLAQLQSLENRLAPLAGLPEADAALLEGFEAAAREQSLRETRLSDHAARLLALQEELAALHPDPAALAAGPEMAALSALKSDYDGAVRDLPRRESDLAEAMSRRNALQMRLGEGAFREEELRLGAPARARLRALLAARSGIEAARAAALTEAEKAARIHAAEAARPGLAAEAVDDAALSALITRLRLRDPAEARARAARDLDEARAALGRALQGLAPWQGDAAALARLTPPPAWQIAAWETALEASRAATAEAEAGARALTAERTRLERELDGSPTADPLEDPALSRSRREALWAAHRAKLDAESADAFESAMREDDRISARLAEALSGRKSRALLEERAADLASRLAACQREADDAASQRDAVLTELAAAAASLSLPGAATGDLKGWIQRRDQALDLASTCQSAGEGLRRAEEACREAATALARALGDPPGSAEGEGAYDMLLARASARAEAANRQYEARERLASLAADLAERRAALTAAETARDHWLQSWQMASAGTLLEKSEPRDTALGDALDILEEWSLADQSVAALTDRIQKMRANRLAFETARSLLLQKLEAAPDLDWAELSERLRRAGEAARDHRGLSARIEEIRRDSASDQRLLTAALTRLAGIGAQLGWQEDQGPLSSHIARCREASGLRREIGDLQQALAGRPLPDPLPEAGMLRSEISSTKSRLDMLRSETEAAQARALIARGKIDAVGGDEALARIEEDRSALLLEMRERSEAHLRRRFGLMAFEEGLKRYREGHRSAMLSRASSAFSQLSEGAYSGLSAQADGPREVLVATAASGQTKLAADLSKGTRFQLYLALRIAGYHELAKSRPAVPFIADDIMETFDDQRAKAAFGLLGEMSKLGQVIYLTHHEHLCSLALSACPGAKVIDLNQI